MVMRDAEPILSAFRGEFGADPTAMANAPGRVNLIGEHTDYNDGLVLPLAIDRSIQVAAGQGTPGEVCIYSAAFNERVTFPTDVSEASSASPWQNYIRGVVAGLRRAGIEPAGADIYIAGDLPHGAGVSSSAALCVASAMALQAMVGAELEPMEIVRLAQRAERDFAGTPCGIMDPYVCIFARSGYALLLDCRACTHEFVSIALSAHSLLVIHSGVRHQLADGEYQRRVEQCSDAVAVLATIDPSISALRDVSMETLRRHADALDPISAKRARHVVSENERVRQAATALAQGRVVDFGRLLFASHASLRDDYAVSCAQIEALMGLLRSHDGVLGARMIGGGFGGAVLALVDNDSVESLAAAIESGYNQARAQRAMMFPVNPSDGAWGRRL